VSHTSGFRAKGFDPRQHHDETKRRHGSEASREFEQRLQQRYREHDKHRRELEEEELDT